MSLDDLIIPSFEVKQFKQVLSKAMQPRFAGYFTAKEAENKQMRLVTGSDGTILETKMVKLYLLVDETDGIIADCKFQVIGPMYLIAAAEIFLERIIQKNYDQAYRTSADLIEKKMQGSSEHALPHLALQCINIVISAMEKAYEKCCDIPFARSYETTPIDATSDTKTIIEGFEKMSEKVQLQLIEEVIDKEIRPYIEMDAGGVRIHTINEMEVQISYEGTCTSCMAATGSTLGAIQNVLRTRIHPDITVKPIL